ncbi:MAG: SpaA isopeptide-forming pilin-related protein, partial [Nocardioidaceae bacterium]
MTLPLLTGSASAAPALGIVIDGNRSSDNGERDWASLTPGTDGYGFYQDHVSLNNSDNDDDVFKSAKETELPTGWKLFKGSVDTGNDIGKTYTYSALDENGHVWFYLGFDRKTDGVGAFSVELNQLPNDAIGMPQRSAGDVRISFVQATGNRQLEQFGVYSWTGSTWQNAPLDSGDHQGMAGESGLFAELAVDLTGTGLQPKCDAGFTAINLRSRSSDSDTSELKDYVTGVRADIRARCRGIRVEKYDATTTAPLSGAKFRLYEDDGDGQFEGSSTDLPVGGEATADQGTGANSFTWSELPWGTYFVKETALPVGYRPDPSSSNDVKKVVLGANTTDGTAVVRFDNPQTRAAIMVSKYDARNAALQGASFQLFSDNGNGVFDAQDTALGTSATGQAADQGPGQNSYTWRDLAYGTYFVKETARPVGYLMDPQANADGTAGTIDDDVKLVRLTADDAGKVIDVEFNNPMVTPEITVEKYDGTTGDALGGAAFKLYKDDGDGRFEGDWIDKPVGGEFTANEGDAGNSHTWSTGLEWGTYFVEESSVPEGYLVDPMAGLQTDAGTLAADYTQQAKTMKVVTVSLVAPHGTVRFHNPRGTGAIQVNKWDWDNKSLGLTGATFQLWRDSDCDTRPDGTDAQVGTVVTANELVAGSALTNSYTWSNLPWGCYVVEEVSPPTGYEADPTVPSSLYPVEITRSDVGESVSVDVYNVEEAGETDPNTNWVVVRKYDADSTQLIDGATFELYQDRDSDGVADADERVSTEAGHSTVGTYGWSGLADGTYLVKEAAPPAGYLPPSADTRSVAVSDGGTGEVEFHNAPIRSSIVAKKLDATTHEPIDTARFQLWADADSNGMLDKLTDTQVGDPRDTDNGVVKWPGLRMGTYFVEETVAPVGYELAGTRVLDVAIGADVAGGEFLRVFENPRKSSTLEVTKQDEDTRAVLA